MKTRNSLTFKLSLIILSVVLFIFAVIVLINFKVSQDLLIKDAKKDAQNITRLTISQIQDALSTVEEPVNIFSKFIAENKMNPGQLKRVVELMVINSDKIASSFICYFHEPGDTNRIEHYYRDALDNFAGRQINIPEHALSKWREKINISRKAYWTEPLLLKETNEITSNYIVPMFDSIDGVGQMSGLIAIEFRLKWLKEFLQENKIYDSDYIFVISMEGRPVVIQGDNFPFNKTILQVAKENNIPEMYELGQNMMAGESGSMEMRDIIDQQRAIVYYEPVPSTNWSVGVVFPKFELFQQIYSTTIKLAVVGLAGFILILVFTIVILRRQTRPLRQLSAAALQIGQGKFDVEMPDIYTHDEVGVLRNSLQSMQDELKSYIKNLVKTVKDKERIAGELQLAQQIQMGYLRSDFDSFAENRDFTLSALLKPAREVGGDFYDFFRISDDTICLAIGDVAGKGVPASLFMSVALTLTRSGNYSHTSLASVVGKINNELCKRNENSHFITAFFGVLDIVSGDLTFCNAGHNYPYLLKGGELFEVHGTHGPALGVLEDVKYKTGKLKFEFGDSIVLYTDGITDAENKNETFFGKTRLEDVLTKNLLKAPADITRIIYKEIRKFTEGKPQSDDLTILALKYSGEKKGREDS